MLGYTATIGGLPLHDPAMPCAAIDGMSVSCKANESGSCSFTVHPTHPHYPEVVGMARGVPVVVMQGDTAVFDGYVWEVSLGWDMSAEVTCRGCLAYLGDTVVRPYTTSRSEFTDESNAGKFSELAPSRPSEYFDWLIDRHNERSDSTRQFRVGLNQADECGRSSIYRSSTGMPSTADELDDKLLSPLGLFLSVRYEDGDRCLDLTTGATSVNGQVIDFGQNLSDYSRVESADGMATACVASGGFSFSEIPDGTSFGVGCVVKGDRLINTSAAAERGLIEASFSDSDAESASDLAESAARWLMAASQPSVTVEVSAVDAALYSGSERPLVCGQLVRVRSIPHGIDAYMQVVEARIDCADPSGTVYRLGVAESSLADSLNAGLNRRVDAVASDASDASSKASAAAIEARSKNRVFYEQPVPPYDKGDLWVRTDPETGRSEILQCTVSRSE